MPTSRQFALLLGALAATAPPCTRASDGALDSSFGSQGRVRVDWTQGEAVPQVLALDSLGRIVLAGYGEANLGTTGFLLARLLPDGTMDGQFAADHGGFLHYDFRLNGIGWSFGNIANSVLVQPDGKIVAAGFAKIDNVASHFALLRVDDMGQLDPNFGDAGAAHFGTGHSVIHEAQALALDSAGRIVIAGFTASQAGDYYVTTARLTSQGQRDLGFNIGGINETVFWDSSDPWNTEYAHYNFGYAVGIGNEGRVVTVGETDSPNPAAAAALRLSDNGQADITFGDQGRVQLALTDGIATAVRVLPSGAVMMAGKARDQNGNAIVFIARLRPEGSLDPTFGNGGIAEHQSWDAGGVNLLAPLRNGGWLVAAADVQRMGAVLLRTDSRGAADNRFGTNGVLHVYFDQGTDFDAAKPVLQPDGKLLVAGHHPHANAAGVYDFGVMRILVDTETIFTSGFETPP